MTEVFFPRLKPVCNIDASFFLVSSFRWHRVRQGRRELDHVALRVWVIRWGASQRASHERVLRPVASRGREMDSVANCTSDDHAASSRILAHLIHWISGPTSSISGLDVCLDGLCHYKWESDVAHSQLVQDYFENVRLSWTFDIRNLGPVVDSR